MAVILFTVPGSPVAKQSFRYSFNGRSHLDPRIKEWQNKVAYYAVQAVRSQWPECLHCPVKVWLVFYLPDKRRVDLDNLSKAVLDGLQPAVIADDSQVIYLCARKHLDRLFPRVEIALQACIDPLT